MAKNARHTSYAWINLRGTVLLAFTCAAFLLICTQAWGGIWLAAENLSDSDPARAQSADSPQVAFDRDGNAMAVWTRLNGSDHKVQARYFSAETGRWGVTADFPTGEGWDNYKPQIAFDERGNAMAVWKTSDASSDRIQARRFFASTGNWGPILTLSSVGMRNNSPQVAMGPEGNAMAVWDSSGVTNTVWARRFSAATGRWDDRPTQISTTGEQSSNAQVAFDSVGDAIAVWQISIGAFSTIQSRSYSLSSNRWSPDAFIVSTIGPQGSNAQVAFDRFDNLVVVWQSNNSDDVIIQARYFNRTGSSWDASPTQLSDSGQDAFDPQIAFDQSGNAIAVWRRLNGDGAGARSIIQSKKRHRATGLWGPLTSLSDANTSTAQNSWQAQIAVGQDGNATAVWQRFDGSHYIIQNKNYTASIGNWGRASNLSDSNPDSAHSADSPQIAIDPDGNAMAVWKRYDGAHYIIQARYFDVDAVNGILRRIPGYSRIPQRTLPPPPPTEHPESLAEFIARQPASAFKSACNLRITKPKLKGRKISGKLFTRDLKGIVEWGTVAGRRVSCKKIKVALFEKRRNGLYLPGTKARVPAAGLKPVGFNGTVNHQRKRYGAHKLRRKELPSSNQTNFTYKAFDRIKRGRAASKALRRKRNKGTFHLYLLADIEGRKVVKKALELRAR